MTTALMPGLCSVTMRALAVPEVATLAAECGLATVEWGADVHVPPGDSNAVAAARSAMDDHGLTCCSYGSYLFARSPSADETTVADVLDTAVALGATNVRVWATFGDHEARRRDRAELVASLQSAAAHAADRHLTLTLEFHGFTPTDTVDGTIGLLDEVGASNLLSGWQPEYWTPTPPDPVGSIGRLAPRLGHVHVYEWRTAQDRRPLQEGEHWWPSALAAAAEVASPWPHPRAALLEFVADDDPVRLRADATTLLRLLRTA